MAGKNHKHDLFRCPHTNSDWHRQAVELMKFMSACPSAKLCDLLTVELQQILRDKKPTKPEFSL
jgi:hypothetical protein